MVIKKIQPMIYVEHCPQDWEVYTTHCTKLTLFLTLFTYDFVFNFHFVLCHRVFKQTVQIPADCPTDCALGAPRSIRQTRLSLCVRKLSIDIYTDHWQEHAGN